MIEDEIIKKNLILSKSGERFVSIHTRRCFSADSRYAISEAICDETGKLTKISKVYNEYAQVGRLVKITPNCFYIEAKFGIDGQLLEVFKIQKIDRLENSVVFERVAILRDKHWDDSSYVKMLKPALTSALNKAKKYYSLTDLT